MFQYPKGHSLMLTQWLAEKEAARIRFQYPKGHSLLLTFER